MMNMQQMMKQAQDLQKKMATVQNELENKLVIGISGGGMVKITSNCKGSVKKIEIDKSLLVPDEVEVLEDLILAAFNNAKLNAENTTQDEMSKLGISPDILKMM